MKTRPTTLGTLTLLSLLLLPALAQAQGPGQRSERVAAAKIGFLTERLALDADQAAAFFPVYREYDQQRTELFIEHRQHQRQMGEFSGSKQDYLQAMEEGYRILEEMNKLDRTYRKRLLGVLTVEQMASLYRAERDFRRELIRRFGRDN